MGVCLVSVTVCHQWHLTLKASLSPSLPPPPPSLSFSSSLPPSLQDSFMSQYGSRSKLRYVEKQVLEDYLWELKVSCNRHRMSGHPGKCVCMCVCGGGGGGGVVITGVWVCVLLLQSCIISKLLMYVLHVYTIQWVNLVSIKWLSPLVLAKFKFIALSSFGDLH